jgi:hypothetical protein
VAEKNAQNEAFSYCGWWLDALKEGLFAAIFFWWLLIGFPWTHRARQWWVHVTTCANIKLGKQQNTFDANDYGSARIDFIVGYLDVVDRKLGAVLQLQALLAAVASLLLNGLVKSGQSIATISVPPSLKAFGVVFLVNTMICLICVTHIYWGDLHAVGEKTYVKKLIHAVMMRTAGFRLAVPLTILSVILLARSVYCIRS